jgi:hypothetical protein
LAVNSKASGACCRRRAEDQRQMLPEIDPLQWITLMVHIAELSPRGWKEARERADQATADSPQT